MNEATFVGRVLIWVRIMAISYDELWQTRIFGIAYIFRLGPRPRARDTISAVVGRNAMAGRRWALVAESVIDWLAERFGSGPWHCRRAALRDPAPSALGRDVTPGA